MKSVSRAFRIPEHVASALADRADDDGVTQAEIVRRALTVYLGGESSMLSPANETPSRPTGGGSGKVRYERGSGDRYYAYIPKEKNPKNNSAFRFRVIHVGNIERHGGMWFWFLRNDHAAGVSNTLASAMDELEKSL